MNDMQNKEIIPKNSENTKDEMRIAKAIARAGICSRREAERLVVDKCVSINGKIIPSPNVNVTKSDIIKINGKQIPKIEPSRLWLYHKPVGVICTNKDEKVRKTIFDDMPSYLPRVISVGRLDINSEGLLLLCNDGELARKLETPSNNHKRIYKVRVFGRVDIKNLKRLENGIVIDSVRYAKIIAEPMQAIDPSNKSPLNIWLKIILTEGKNREIRKVMEHLGYKVSRLIRISFGEFHLKQLKKSQVIEVSKGEIYLKAMGGKAKKTWAKAKQNKSKNPRKNKRIRAK